MLAQITCPICGNRAVEESEFCKSHYQARLRLESAFTKWRMGYGDEMNWRTFLERLLQLHETGQKVREVVSFLREKDEA